VTYKASTTCVFCRGAGIDYRGKECPCLHRSVFRHWFAAYLAEPALTRDARFRLDFLELALKALTHHELAVFQYHFVMGQDWKSVVENTRTSTGEFFLLVYSLQEKLGRELRDRQLPAATAL
jgi:hypothetical protein